MNLIYGGTFYNEGHMRIFNAAEYALVNFVIINEVYISCSKLVLVMRMMTSSKLKIIAIQPTPEGKFTFSIWKL